MNQTHLGRDEAGSCRIGRNGPQLFPLNQTQPYFGSNQGQQDEGRTYGIGRGGPQSYPPNQIQPCLASNQGQEYVVGEGVQYYAVAPFHQVYVRGEAPFQAFVAAPSVGQHPEATNPSQQLTGTFEHHYATGFSHQWHLQVSYLNTANHVSSMPL